MNASDTKMTSLGRTSVPEVLTVMTVTSEEEDGKGATMSETLSGGVGSAGSGFGGMVMNQDVWGEEMPSD